MREAQEAVAKFNLERGWEKDTKCMKDLLLNICEEVGEAWSIIKWVRGKKEEELLRKYKEEYEDFVGDSLYLILKIAWLLDIDSKQALMNTLKEYEKRFPAEIVRKKKHGNPLAGGVDNKKPKVRD
ncbi:hypothetical protein D6745_03010 [Candidatus Woesearchaeota archaeon]|nr:MAG: hypothetical protein D6745_03010 [Candidatus Woesearchaeota archaeon]